jgi:hypothetical protein
MTSRSAGGIFAGWVIAVVLFAGAAGAQVPAPVSPSPAAAEAEARAHFNKGDEHFKKGEYREAYDEFQKSLAAKKTRGTMAIMASSLKGLGRYDDALEVYEQVLREFPNPPASFEARVTGEIKALQELVGTLVVAGDAPAGALLFIDDRYRGKLPLSAPLRVAQGMHKIRVEKEGFDPITVTVEVSAGKENVAQLVAKSKQGRLSVSEKHNWALHVEVDGKDVGVTPWEGLVEPGEHRVRLYGYMGVDALAACEAPEVRPGEKAEPGREGVKMGSPVETAMVKLYEVTPVVLGVEEQDASLKIESTPKGARLRIDSKDVGQTPWEGRLALGEHAIEVMAGGFVSAKQGVRLEKRKQREVTVVLERERKPELEGFPAAAKIGAGVAYGAGALGLGVFAVTGGLLLVAGKDLKDACPNDLCPGSQVERAKGLQDTAQTLGIVAPTALVVAGAGAAAGTVILFAARPRGKDKQATTVGVDWKVGLGPGGFQMEGSF